MRALVLVVALAGCGPDVDGHTHDAQPIDVAIGTSQCSAASGTASVTFSDDALLTHYDRLDAGGTINTGPVAPVSGPSMFANLLLTNTDPLSQNEAGCCQYRDQTCCHTDGLVITTNTLEYGAEVGDHDVTVTPFDASFSLPGTLSITHFESPWDHAPGRISGSISVISNVRTISGSFDNAFCPALVSATI